MKIIQIAESLSKGDAVGNNVIEINKLLKNNSLESCIYVCNNDNFDISYRKTVAKHISQLSDVSPDDVIIYHHCFNTINIDKFIYLNCKKILIYHNITPPSFFKDFDTGMEQSTEKGLAQLESIKNIFSAAICPSNFNKNDLINMGFTCPIYVIPLLVDLEAYDVEPNNLIIKKYNDGYTNILFVGRISPQKKHEDLIHAFHIYRKIYNKKTRLIIVGSSKKDKYFCALKKYIESNNVKNVVFTGKTTFKDLISYYKVSHVFLCMSEHEGFCVPLIEAMHFKIPVIAYNSSAIAETMGESETIFSNKNYFDISFLINRVIVDSKFKKQIIHKQDIQLKKFNYYTISNLLIKVIKNSDINCEFEHDDTMYDVVIPLKFTDYKLLHKNIPYLCKNLNCGKIVIISNKKIKQYFSFNNKVIFYDEDKIIDGLNLTKVKKCLLKVCGKNDNAGWFFQQFLKLGYSRVCEKEYYLVWDADTLLIKKLEMFDKKGKPFFNLKREYTPQYFLTLKNIFSITKKREESFISEHMLFNKKICLEMLNEIEKSKCNGNTFWEKILFNCDFSIDNYCFSEYETYGSYCDEYYPNFYSTRKLPTLRTGIDFLGYNPSSEIINWASNDFFTISFEHFSQPLNDFVRLTENYKIRNNFSLLNLISVYIDIKKIQYCYNYIDENEYNKIVKRKEFDFVFYNNCKY